jgi:hypothetical protein
MRHGTDLILFPIQTGDGVAQTGKTVLYVVAAFPFQCIVMRPLILQ